MPHPTEPTHPGGHWPPQTTHGAPATTDDGPPAPLLAASFFLAGLGTVLLGPLLPALLREWSLSDQRGGLLLLAKFAGATLGGILVPQRLRLGILAGHLLSALGFLAFALAPSLALALPALFLSGYGLGNLIASTNITAGRRWPAHTGSALALVNLFWSLGAVSTGLLAAALLPHFGWRTPTLALAALLALTGLAAPLLRTLTRSPAAQTPQTPRTPHSPLASPTPTPTHNANPQPAHASPPDPYSLSPTPSRASALRFAALLFLYGGLETCLTAWLTTFALRFAGGTLLGGQSGFVLLWLALTAGRALASLAMRRLPEPTVQRASLALCLLLIALLATTHTSSTLSVACILLGLALAPIFPSTYALFLRKQPSARLAGTVLAVSGLGAALFPWLMGVLSTHTQSLRTAMLIPALLIPAMLTLTRHEQQHPPSTF